MSAFLFGKLPAFGDFVARGLSVPMRSWWDSWCSVAVLDARDKFGDGFHAHYQATPPRRFLIAPPIAGGSWQAGCIIPSTDRAGRIFPFVLGVSSSEPIDAAEAVGIGERLAACVARAFEQSIDLDALIIAAEAAAGDTSHPARPVHPITVRETGCIGENPHSVEV